MFLMPFIRRFGEAGRPAHPAVIGRAGTGFLFYAIVTPIALMRRLLGRDPLRLKRDPKARTYWVARGPAAPGFTGPDESQF